MKKNTQPLQGLSFTNFLAINQLYRCCEIDLYSRNLFLRKLFAASISIAVAILGQFASSSAQAATATWDGGDATFNGTYGGTSEKSPSV